MPELDKNFAGAIPRVYEQYLVPLIFGPYAADLTKRLQARKPARILETAAGTGVVTREMSRALPDATIVATDLNPGMIEEATAAGTSGRVEWRAADALALPFPDGSFDAVVCQFGVMFFPDKVKGFSEARRVLAPGGVFLFNVWDRISENEVADVVTGALEPLFPEDPPRFLARTPYAYNDTAVLTRDLEAGGFKAPSFSTVTARSRASAKDAAIAFVQGTPLRAEVEARDPSGLARSTDAATRALEKKFGTGGVDAKIQAIVVTAEP